MHRRTTLNVTEHLDWDNVQVTIATNDTAIIRAALGAGMQRQQHVRGSTASLRFEVTVECDGDVEESDTTHRVVRIRNSLYLFMGDRQWFALDEQNGVGVGSVTVVDAGSEAESKIARYMHSVLEVVEDSLERTTAGVER